MKKSVCRDLVFISLFIEAFIMCRKQLFELKVEMRENDSSTLHFPETPFLPLRAAQPIIGNFLLVRVSGQTNCVLKEQHLLNQTAGLLVKLWLE